jgi:hypothetical protein
LPDKYTDEQIIILWLKTTSNEESLSVSFTLRFEIISQIKITIRFIILHRAPAWIFPHFSSYTPPFLGIDGRKFSSVSFTIPFAALVLPTANWKLINSSWKQYFSQFSFVFSCNWPFVLRRVLIGCLNCFVYSLSICLFLPALK